MTQNNPLNGPIISIEDDQDDQYLIATAIKKLNISNELRFFSNGQVALEYLTVAQELPFLILCDINMPIMNGLELRQRLNDNDYLRKKSVPFVFLTTAANQETVRLAYDETVQGFCLKSGDLADFDEQIRLIVSYWKRNLHPNSIL